MLRGLGLETQQSKVVVVMTYFVSRSTRPDQAILINPFLEQDGDMLGFGNISECHQYRDNQVEFWYWGGSIFDPRGTSSIPFRELVPINIFLFIYT